MGFRDMCNLKSGYDSGIDDILHDFYIPVLAQAVSYKRIAGFFSSTSLSVAAAGIAGLIANDGVMEIIVSPRLSVEDVNVMEKSEKDPESIIAQVLLNELENIEYFIQHNRLKALAWLLAKGKLKIKVATVFSDSGKILNEEAIKELGLFHIKVGILEDKNGDIITFSGSINETANAWVRNVEEFKVFKSWDQGQSELAKIDIEKFNSYWNSKVTKVCITNLPNAVKEKIICYSPKSFDEVQEEVCAYEINQHKIGHLKFKPYKYQVEALEVWKRKYNAIFEMATGTGKTKTAELCIEYFIKMIKKSAVVFIVCPQNTLSRQWKDDLVNSGLICNNYIIADSSSDDWKIQLECSLIDITMNDDNNKLFVYTTFDTYCSRAFMEIISENKYETKYFIIGDEVHGLGATKRRNGLLDIYEYRLGLSATPERWFDENGTKSITDYFGADRFEFTMHQALTTINPITGYTYLTPYEYIPKFISLTYEEIIKYNSITKKIIKQLSKCKNSDEAAEKLEQLMFMRADIHKSAENKYEAFRDILYEIGDDINDTIIFVSPTQIDKVITILSEHHIRCHRFTSQEGVKKEKKIWFYI